MIKFSKIPIGVYFTMKKGLLFRKVSITEAVDVWSGRKIVIKPETECNVEKKHNNDT